MAEEFSGMILRRLGETADGLRDQDMALVANSHTGELQIISKKDLDDDTGQPRKYVLVREIEKQETASFAEFLRLDFIGMDGTTVVGHCCPPADALFWTDSSLEKFLYPYYEQVRIFPEGDLTLLKEQLRDPEKRKLILAVRHDRPSNPIIIKKGNPKCDGDYGGGPRFLVPRFKRDDGAEWFTPKEFRDEFDRRRKAGTL